MKKIPVKYHIFINCRFDAQFWPFFRAIIFAVLDCGFEPRAALEHQGAEEPRLEKLLKIILEAQYCISDISLSKVLQADSPRLNMAFELGLFLGSLKHGPKRKPSRSLFVMDSKKHRPKKTISDLAGVEVEAHGNNPLRVIALIRNWLRSLRRADVFIPTAANIQARYVQFTKELPVMMQKKGHDPVRPLGLEDYLDFVEFVKIWLVTNDRNKPTS